MKKLSFVLALVFAGSMAMAQNLSTVGQNGTGNNANVLQTSTVIGDISSVQQAGNSNDADVIQDNNGFGGAAHHATVASTGDLNTASITQINFAGDAAIIQKGNSNKATITENGNFTQPNPDAPVPFDAYAYQEGNTNTITMDVYGDIASAYAFQKGNLNTIAQSIGQGIGDKVANSWVSASQTGNGNFISQVIEGLGWSGDVDATWQRARAIQVGDGNWASQRQYNDINPATDNYAQVEQYGNGNQSIQNQAGKSNQSWVFQSGLDNSTTVQIGTSNYVKVIQ